MKLSFTEPCGLLRQRIRCFMQNRTFRLIMRVSYLNIFFLAFSLKLLAFESSAQSMENTFVTLDLHNAPLKSVFEEIEKQTEFIFVFSPEKLNGYPNADFPKGRYGVKGIVEKVLRGTDLWYQQKNKYIVISLPVEKTADSNTVENETPNSPTETLFTVTGKIVDGSNQQPLAGVNIIVKGTTRGTTTDGEGKFAIDADENEVLVFSFIGFKTTEMTVGNQTTMDIVMVSDAVSLNEVEIVGTNYFSTTREKSTMNIAKVDGKDIENQPVTSLLNSLVGRMPGVDITPFNGVPGGWLTIQVRGKNSLRTNGSYPLYVIDGVPVDSRPIESASSSLADFGFDPLSSLNQNNIESIEVLKDAAATAIYGSRGANGVIVIKTKQGDGSGKTNVDLSFYTGLGKISNKLDLLNTQQYVAMRKEAYQNDGVTPSGISANDLLLWDTTRNTDWQKELLGGTASITDMQANISGGSKNTFFTLGTGYHKENVVYPGDFGFQRVTGHFSLNHSSTNQKFKASISTNYGLTVNKMFDDASYVGLALSLSPNAPALYNAQGKLNWEFRPDGSNSWINPLSVLMKTHETTTGNLVINSTLSYEVLPGLLIKSSFGFTDLNGNEVIKNPIASRAPNLITSTSAGSATFGTNKRNSWIVEPQILYSKKFGDHQLEAVVGVSFQESNTVYQSVRGSGYSSDILLNSVRAAVTKTFTVDDENDYRYSAGYVRLGYNWKEKYLLDLSGRRDGSSRFGPNNRFGNFGAFGAAWIFTKERFISENVGFLSFGKFRGSYGTTGNDQIGDYRYYNTYGISQFLYQGRVSLYPEALFNPDFAWEKTKKLEVATELGFFDDRIFFQASWYRNKSSNQLVDYQLPAITGFPSVFTNFDATIENYGWEFVLNTQNIEKGALRWSTSLNFSIPKNKLVKFDGVEDSPYASFLKVGEPLSIQYLYTWKGINPETGVHEIVDMNDDGVYNNDDKQFMKPLGRRYYGGLINTLSYKGIELSFLLQYSNQTSVGHLPNSLPGTSRVNQPAYVQNRWVEAGNETDVARFSQASAAGQFYANVVRNSDYNTKDASFIRLRTLNIAYNFPNSLMSNLKLQSASVYIQGQNLFTITDYDEVLDIETINGLPPLRMILIGVRVKI